MCKNCHNYYLDCKGYRKGCVSFKSYNEEQYKKDYEKIVGEKLTGIKGDKIEKDNK